MKPTASSPACAVTSSAAARCGGGYGTPHDRSFEAVLNDVLDGYVSRESAIRDYGVNATRLDEELARWFSFI